MPCADHMAWPFVYDARGAMKRVNLVAVTPLIHGGKRLAAGDAFTATPQDARVLKAIKKAQDAQPPDYSYIEHYAHAAPPAPEVPLFVPEQGYETASMVVEEAETPAPKKKRTYKTRVVKPKDE